MRTIKTRTVVIAGGIITALSIALGFLLGVAVADDLDVEPAVGYPPTR